MTPPPYRDQLTTGIVHFGPGAFHRAHQADYIDRLLHQDPRWGIAAVSLRTARTIQSLEAQDRLYTLAILDTETSFRTVGPHRRFLGRHDVAAIRGQLLDPAIRMVTSTVTEKGYCLSGDGSLNFDHPDIQRDLVQPKSPISLIGWLALGLADRRAEGLAPFATICCDNMTSNGKKVRNAVAAFAERSDPELARWIDGEAQFPDTMVDSITPATDDNLRRLVQEKTGFGDTMPVAREAFTQWVVENVLPTDLPALQSVGVTLTSEVNAWERAKLRILNGAHSTAAYVGLLLGHETVADAMEDSLLSAFLRQLVLEDIIPTLRPSRIDLESYAHDTFNRFRNRAIGHRLSQIAWDGSQKLPYRLLDTIVDARAAGRPIDRLVLPIAAWILFLERQARSGASIVDPHADRLSAIGRGSNVTAEILSLPVFPERLSSDPDFRSAVGGAVEQMRKYGVAATINSEIVSA